MLRREPKEWREERPWEGKARERGLIPQPHGGALMPGGGYRAGAGRPRSRVKAALEKAKGDPGRQLELAGEFVRDKTLSVDELVRAATFMWRLCIRLDRAGRRRQKRATFRVVARSAVEMAGIEAPTPRTMTPNRN